jgi:hypothetical protein
MHGGACVACSRTLVSACSAVQASDGHVVHKRDWCRNAATVLHDVLNKDQAAIRRGFRLSGLCPFSPQEGVANIARVLHHQGFDDCAPPTAGAGDAGHLSSASASTPAVRTAYAKLSVRDLPLEERKDFARQAAASVVRAVLDSPALSGKVQSLRSDGATVNSSKNSSMARLHASGHVFTMATVARQREEERAGLAAAMARQQAARAAAAVIRLPSAPPRPAAGVGAPATAALGVGVPPQALTGGSGAVCPPAPRPQPQFVTSVRAPAPRPPQSTMVAPLHVAPLRLSTRFDDAAAAALPLPVLPPPDRGVAAPRPSDTRKRGRVDGCPGAVVSTSDPAPTTMQLRKRTKARAKDSCE